MQPGKNCQFAEPKIILWALTRIVHADLVLQEIKGTCITK
jgi:hypothetical protein